LEHGARDRHALLLAARELEAPLADRRLVTLGRTGDEAVNLRELGSGDDLFVGRAGPSVRDVVFDRVVEEDRVLRDDPDRRAQAALLHVADVLAVDGAPPTRDG